MPPVSPPVGWTKGLQIDIGAAQISNSLTEYARETEKEIEIVQEYVY